MIETVWGPKSSGHTGIRRFIHWVGRRIGYTLLAVPVLAATLLILSVFVSGLQTGLTRATVIPVFVAAAFALLTIRTFIIVWLSSFVGIIGGLIVGFFAGLGAAIYDQQFPGVALTPDHIAAIVNLVALGVMAAFVGIVIEWTDTVAHWSRSLARWGRRLEAVLVVVLTPYYRVQFALFPKRERRVGKRDPRPLAAGFACAVVGCVLLLNPAPFRELRSGSVASTIESWTSGLGARSAASGEAEERSLAAARVVNASSLNVRDTPGTNAAILTQVRGGDVLQVVERSAQWIKVRLPDGTEGWVSGSYVELIETR